MSEKLSRSYVQLDVSLGEEPHPEVPRPETPFNIAVLGNFSGSRDRAPGVGGPLGQRPVPVDRYDFDEVLGRFAPELKIRVGPADAPVTSVRFTELDDFHPDSLYARLPIFRSLRELREEIASPRSFRRAADQVRDWTRPADATPRPPAPSAGGLLDQILEDTPAPTRQENPLEHGDLHDYLRQIVAPHLVPNPDPKQSEMLEQLDRATSAQMRALLHHPEFQALEALWRSVFFLVRRLDTDVQLRVYLIDVSRDELTADLAPGRELRETALHRLLVERSATPDGEPWAVVIGNYAFGAGSGDLDLLARIGAAARMAGAPWISEADPRLAAGASAGQDDAQTTWPALRQSRDAAYLGLALPRFLLRLPYGEETEPCDAFSFEEMPEGPVHGQYLWGNPAIACALLLGRSFLAAGWTMRPGQHLDIDRLPLHLLGSGADTTVQPCAEVLLTEKEAEYLIDQGLMPLASMKNQDAVRLIGFRSIAQPPAPLAGRWSSSPRS